MLRRLGRRVRPHLTYANVVATICLVMATVGTAYATGIGSAGIADNSIQSRDIRDGSVASIDLQNGSIGVLDLSAAARAALRGANGTDGADGAPGVAGRDGINGKDGARGPEGPQGPAGADGTSYDDLLDLETLTCSAGSRSGHVDITVGTASGHTAAVTLTCALTPLSCPDTQPSTPAHVTFVCNDETGSWQASGCAAGWYNDDLNLADGCETQTPPSLEQCNGLDDNYNGGVDEGLTPPASGHANYVCQGVAGWVIISCQQGWHDTNGNPADGCETQGVETCNNMDDDGDGAVDEGLSRGVANGTLSCQNGIEVVTCYTGFYNKNGLKDDGCESQTP